MDTFEFFIEDDRYAVPSLEFIFVPDVAVARELAAKRLLASAHHWGVEVRQAGKPVCYVSRAKPDRAGGCELHDS